MPFGNLEAIFDRNMRRDNMQFLEPKNFKQVIKEELEREIMHLELQNKKTSLLIEQARLARGLGRELEFTKQQREES